MMDWSSTLMTLVQQLDQLTGRPTSYQLGELLKRTALRAEDVAPFIQESSGHYHRASVVRREHYELLVITWRPQQGSVPHDHSGSTSAMYVIQGTALEGSYRVAEDGYAELEFENELNEGEVTAWQDAGVHAVRNGSSDETLITVNIYAPPLGEFRRLVPRTTPVQFSSSLKNPTVLVVGGGFSGCMTAAQLISQANRNETPIDVVLVERSGSVGEGVAYSTSDLNHLLNVPAGRMSAWPDKPTDFVEWLTEHYGVTDPTQFVPRKWYGEYVRDALHQATNESNGQSGFRVILDEVRRITRRPDGGWLVSFASHASVSCDATVLAIGHRPPSDPIAGQWSGPRLRMISDPWRPFATNAIRPDEPVVVLGSGLTAVDTVLPLISPERTARVYLISRRGLIPQQHGPKPLPPDSLRELIDTWSAHRATINELTRMIRQRIEYVECQGGDWRSVIDGLRPFMGEIWGSLTLRDRRRFLRHLRPFWEVHRHRTARQIGDRFNQMIDQGIVKILAGRIVAAQATKDHVRMFVREKGHERSLDLTAAWVINCTGPGPSNHPESNPAIGSLLIANLVKADPLSLGLETSQDGMAVGGSGTSTDGLYVVGTLRKPATWESTAVPELRVQAAKVAEAILQRLYAYVFDHPDNLWSI